MSSLEKALEALISYIAAFGELPQNPSQLIEHATANRQPQCFGPSDAQRMIDLYRKNLNQYRVAKSTKSSTPATEECMTSRRVSIEAHEVVSPAVCKIVNENAFALSNPSETTVSASGQCLWL